jgi:hypothetical protein
MRIAFEQPMGDFVSAVSVAPNNQSSSSLSQVGCSCKLLAKQAIIQVVSLPEFGSCREGLQLTYIILLP